MPKVRISHAVDQLADDLYGCRDFAPHMLTNTCRLILLMAPGPWPIEISNVIEQASETGGSAPGLPTMVRKILMKSIDSEEVRPIGEGWPRTYQRTDRLKREFDKTNPNLSNRKRFCSPARGGDRRGRI